VGICGRSAETIESTLSALRAHSGAAHGVVADVTAPGEVERFVEKPDAATAQSYVSEGYLWNSGNFLFGAQKLLAEYRRFEPDSAAAIEQAVEAAGRDLGFVTLDPQAFGRAVAKSIDYAVMEKTADAVVVPLDAGWSDVGSWAALHEASEVDAEGNVARGDVLTEASSGCYLYAESRLVAAVGLKDHVVVDIDLRTVGGSALTADIDVPKDRPAEEMAQGIPVTYVPARNTAFLALALGYAEVLESFDIFIGVNAIDFSGYPDCRPEFLAAFEAVANLGTRAGVEGRGRFRVPAQQMAEARLKAKKSRCWQRSKPSSGNFPQP